MKVAAVVPLKDPGAAKRRLAPVLDTAERIGLLKAMLGDVLAALDGARGIASVHLVGHDPMLDSFGPPVIREPCNRGYNEAVRLAADRLAAAGVEAMLVLPGDLPLLRRAEVERLAAPLPGEGVRIAPARGSGGTNGLLLRPPRILAPCFGPASFARHRAAAAAGGVALTVLDLPGLAFDIDTPQDLAALCAAASPCKSRDFLVQQGLPARLAAIRRHAGRAGAN